MTRRYGRPPRADKRYTPRPGVYAILPRQGKLLLTHQADPDDEVQLPGGGVDPGEHPLAALHREVREETGWRIARPQRLGVYRRFAYMPEYDLWAEKICHIYLARPTRRAGPPREAGHTALWLPSAAATRVLANAGDADFVASVQGRGLFWMR